MGRQTRRAGANKSRGKANLPPTGEGKRQSPYSGAANYLRKRSTGPLQASRHHPELNLGDSEEEMAWRSEDPQAKTNPKRPKAGR